MFMKSAKRGRPSSSAKRLPCAPARTERPDLDSGSMARNALSFPGRTGNSITVATDPSSAAGVPTEMEPATPSGCATSASKNARRLDPLTRRTSSPTSHPNVTP